MLGLVCCLTAMLYQFSLPGNTLSDIRSYIGEGDISFTGRIIEPPEESGSSVHYVLSAEMLEVRGISSQKVKGKVMVSLPLGFNFSYGDRLEVAGELITWTQVNMTGTVTIDLYKGGVYRKTLGTAEATSGTFSWLIAPLEPSGTDYRVLVWQGGVSDDSDGDFAITPLLRPRKVDFNGDGQEDILWRYYGSGGQNLVWFLGDMGVGSQPLQMPAPQAAALESPGMLPGEGQRPPERAFAAADLEGLGGGLMTDLATRRADLPDQRRVIPGADPTGTQRALSDPADVTLVAPTLPPAVPQAKNTATGTRGFAVAPPIDDLNWQIRGTGDFDNDGHVDILWRYKGPGGRNLIWHMDGTGMKDQAALPAVVDLNWQIVGTGDFDRDGHVDILWRNTAQGDNLVWYMRDTEVFGLASLPAMTDLKWEIAAAADFDNDGHVDILWRQKGSPGKIMIWYLDGVEMTGQAFLPSVSDEKWQIAGVGDYDNDSHVDILWRYNGTGGRNLIWSLEGANVIGLTTLPSVPDLNWRIGNR